MRELANMYEISLDYFVGIIIVLIAAIILIITNNILLAIFDLCIIILLALAGNYIYTKKEVKAK